jgi:hypothetical protein
LAIHARGTGIRRQLQAIRGLILHNWSDDGEAIFLFPPSLFDAVADIVKPRRKRQLGEAQRRKATERLRAYRFRPKSAHVNAKKAGINRAISVRPIVGVGE